MTIANETRRTSVVGTNTAGQEVPFDFPITDTSDVTIITRITTTGVEDTLNETTDYTVSISGDTGGTVTMVSAIATTKDIHVIRDTPNLQSLDLEQGGTFNAENIEDALDKNTKLTIENADAVLRSVRAPATDDPSLDMELPNSIDRASQYLAFDSDGEPTVVSSVAPDTATITAFAETFLGDPNAADVRTTIDAQQSDGALDDLSDLTLTDGNFIVADGANWVVETTSTARASMGALAASDILCHEGAVLTYENEVLTWVT